MPELAGWLLSVPLPLPSSSWDKDQDTRRAPSQSQLPWLAQCHVYVSWTRILVATVTTTGAVIRVWKAEALTPGVTRILDLVQRPPTFPDPEAVETPKDLNIEPRNAYASLKHSASKARPRYIRWSSSGIADNVSGIAASVVICRSGWKCTCIKLRGCAEAGG